MQTSFAVYDALAAIAVPPDKLRVVVESLEHDMALFATRSHFEQLDQFSAGRFELLRAETATTRERIETTNRRFDQMDARFEQIEGRFEQIDQRFEQIDKRFEQMEARFGQIDKRFEQMEARFGQIDQRFELVDQRFVELRTELVDKIAAVGLESKKDFGIVLAKLLLAEKNIERNLTIRLGIMMAGMLTALGTILTLLRV